MVSNLISPLSRQDGSMYHIVFDNFFTSLCLLQRLSENGFAGTGKLQNHRYMKAPLKEVKEMENVPRVSFDVVLDTKSSTSVSRWKYCCYLLLFLYLLSVKKSIYSKI